MHTLYEKMMLVEYSSNYISTSIIFSASLALRPNIHNTKKLFYCNRSCIYLFSVHNLFVCVSYIPQRLCVFSGFDVILHFLCSWCI
mmetsp:Transcript_61131/g.107370  ORF Transcript_61131/g.107370 Transcript_61131/m.107370 type:complete len:86 (-) Transcript_61131:109-366(-)